MKLQLEAKQMERKRIAQELHDTLLQGFTGISLKLEALNSTLPPELSKTKEQLTLALDEMDHYLRETRRSIWNLRAPASRSARDLTKVLPEAGKRALAGSGTRLSFWVQGKPRKISDGLEHQLLRIYDEALANVVKHAQASKVEVILDFTSQEVQLQIGDNGRGIEPNRRDVSQWGHFGLLGIRERVASVSGTLSIDSAPGMGTRLLVTIRTEGAHQANTAILPENGYILEPMPMMANYQNFSV
jgi:signal transduction histidine kinase